MRIESNPVTIQYYLDHQRYLERLSDNRRLEQLRLTEIEKQKTNVERMDRARELDKNLGQNIDIYV